MKKANLNYEGFEISETLDGKWKLEDTYEYFDSKANAMKAVDEYIKESSPTARNR